MLKIFIVPDKDLKTFIKQNKMKQDREYQDINSEILTPKQMLQRLPIALAQVKAGNNSKNLLIEIRQIVYNQPICIQ